MSKFVIYKATNTKTGKAYVGKSADGLNKRKQSHIATAKFLGQESSIFHRALNSYGPGTFTWEVLEVCRDHGHMNEREVFYIAAHNCQHPNGYNMTLGGGSYGFQRSPETKELLAEKSRQAHLDPEYCAKVYPKLKGLVPPNKGKATDPAIVRKSTDARLKTIHAPGYVNPNVGSSRTPEQATRIKQSIQGKQLTGESWTKAHGDQYTPEVREKMRQAKLGKKPSNTKKVRCTETGQVFAGLTEAAAALGINRQSIWMQIKGKLKSAGGKHFEYITEAI